MPLSDIRMGATHVYLSTGQRAVIVNINEDGTVDAQVLLKGDAGSVHKRLPLGYYQIAADEFNADAMPDSEPGQAIVPLKRVGLWSRMKSMVGLKKP